MAAAETDQTQTGALRTTLVHDPVFLDHETGPGFPEHPDRLRHLNGHLRKHPITERLLWIAPDQETDPMPWIRLLHDPEYVDAFKQACEAGEIRLCIFSPPIDTPFIPGQVEIRRSPGVVRAKASI